MNPLMSQVRFDGGQVPLNSTTTANIAHNANNTNSDEIKFAQKLLFQKDKTLLNVENSASRSHSRRRNRRVNTTLGKSPIIKSKSPNQQTRSRGGVRIHFGKRHASTANIQQPSNKNGVRDSSVVDDGEALVIPRHVPRVEVASKFNSNVSG